MLALVTFLPLRSVCAPEDMRDRPAKRCTAKPKWSISSISMTTAWIAAHSHPSKGSTVAALS
jgi:hypothetical protein